MAEEGNKLTLRRLEVPIHKFIKVALPTDLERLQKHHNNILKYQHSQQWDRLHHEHINASRTVQQLRANIREMEKLCTRVRAEDADALEALVKPVRDRASAAAQKFLLLHSNLVPQLTPPPTSGSQPSSCVSSSSHFDGEVGEELLSGRQTQLHLPEIPADQSAAESWDNLEEDLKELSGLVTEFSLLVHASLRGRYTVQHRTTAGAPEALHQGKRRDSGEDRGEREDIQRGKGEEQGIRRSRWRTDSSDYHSILRDGEGKQTGWSQQEKIDSIEDNVNTAAANVEEGTKSLGKAVGYKLAVMPIAGALLGGVIAGPLGLLAGFKVAGVAAALGGGALGFAGGSLVQKHHKAQVDQQMKQLTAPPPEPPAKHESSKDK